MQAKAATGRIIKISATALVLAIAAIGFAIGFMIWQQSRPRIYSQARLVWAPIACEAQLVFKEMGAAHED